MSDPLIREIDNYVILEPGREERFLSSDETLKWLEDCLRDMSVLPLDLKNKGSLKNVAKHLIDTSCDLEVKPGFTVQWFAIRMDPPNDAK